MNYSLEELKKKSDDFLNNLVEKVEESKKSNKFKKEVDGRFWVPTFDDEGKTTAIFRWLGIPGSNELPWATYYDYYFEGPNGWYVEKSRWSLGQPDPMDEYNNKLWKADRKDEVRKHSRRLNYVSNIYMISDNGNHENDGKVFLYRYGKKIKTNKIDKIMFPPQGSTQKRENPFDIVNGRNFILEAIKQGDYPNYDASTWEMERSPLTNSDEELNRIINSMYSLKEFTDPENFKSYDDLKARMNQVFGIGSSSSEVKKIEHELSKQVNDSVEKQLSNDEAEFNVDDIINQVIGNK